jgi:hypothetical protein
MEVSADQLKQAVEGQHGCKARLVAIARVKEVFDGQTVWDGVVHVFNLNGHPRATKAYALVIPGGGQRPSAVYAVLHRGGIRSSLDAVRAGIVAERQKPERRI